MKRKDVISWDTYFMALALLTAQRSKDPSTQVGACVVNKYNRVVGIGYNGFPNYCSDDKLPWGRDGDWIDTKYPYVVHAETNAIANATGDLEGCRLYCTLAPCNDCAKVLMQNGIKEVIYLSAKYNDDQYHVAARRLFELGGIVQRQLVPDRDEITLRLDDE